MGLMGLSTGSEVFWAYMFFLGLFLWFYGFPRGVFLGFLSFFRLVLGFLWVTLSRRSLTRVLVSW